jgi:hypothetical protein
MLSLRLGAALLILLAVVPMGRANVPVIVYKDDPGYERARMASKVAPVVVLVSVVLAVLWAALDRSRSGKVAAAVFGVLVLLCGGLMTLPPATRFPDESPGQESPSDALLRPRGSPRGMTPEETTLAGIVAFAALSFGGLALVRLAVRPSNTEGHPPTQGTDSAHPTDKLGESGTS